MSFVCCSCAGDSGGILLFLAELFCLPDKRFLRNWASAVDYCIAFFFFLMELMVVSVSLYLNPHLGDLKDVSRRQEE